MIARCPAHKDRSPSLALKALSDGRTLLHCHASCDVRDIMNAIGLPMAALFEERSLQPGAKLDRSAHDARDVLACLGLEAMIVADCSRQIRRGEALSEVDHARLVTACGRLLAGSEMANPGQAASELRRRMAKAAEVAYA